MNRIGDTLHHTGENERLVRAFVDAGVEFVLVGGLAIAWYCADRQADDMDLIVNPTLENSERICEVLTQLGLEGFRRDAFNKPNVQARLKSVFYAELLTPRTDGPTYAEAREDAIEAKLFGIPIRLASPSNLIKMKTLAADSHEASLKKHKDDIERLLRLV